jgi:hypothetical protein
MLPYWPGSTGASGTSVQNFMEDNARPGARDSTGTNRLCACEFDRCTRRRKHEAGPMNFRSAFEQRALSILRMNDDLLNSGIPNGGMTCLIMVPGFRESRPQKAFVPPKISRSDGGR